MSINKKRGGAAARGAVAATVATAVLLGGFGGFSLWQDSLQGGMSDSINTGQLRINSIEDGTWSFAENDTDMEAKGWVFGEEREIDITQWLASPGDELIYNTTANVTVTGTDMIGAFNIDQTSYTILNPELEGYITVTVANAGQNIYPSDTPQDVPVKITVKFSEDIPGLMGQAGTNVIDLSNITVTLDQVQAPTPVVPPVLPTA